VGDTFYGVVSLDIGLDTMQKILGEGVEIPGESQIVNHAGKLVASLRPFELGDRLELADGLLQASETQVTVNNKFLIAIPLGDGKLWFIHSLSQTSVNLKSAIRAVPYSIIVVFTMVLAYLLIRLRESMKEVSRLATTDALTGTLNRRGFAFEATVLLAHCRRRDKPICLFVLDIDNFKLVNDRYGHAIGDKVLKFVADALRDCVRDEDLISRFGGDEFLVFFPETDLPQAKIVAERVREQIETAVIEPESNCQVTVSIGCTQISDEEDLARAIARGDDALYAAKNQGRNKVIALDFT
jgi:diguanylate cyclase (GGDEF)-like protein